VTPPKVVADEAVAARSVDESPFRMDRLGVLMSPAAGEPAEAWGVLNPATARKGPDLHLFPRMVVAGSYSRIGRARVIFDAAGTPVDVERLGVILEPRAPWELHAPRWILRVAKWSRP
jgi:beta-1,2-mannobiose phosphorylase / 1,2-beta-oligomannan phosphorylase